MKRKIFSILFALVLVLSFSLVTAVPVAAQSTLNVMPIPVSLSVAGGTADWSTAESHTGSNSIHLTTTSLTAGAEARAVIVASSVGVDTLADIDSISWWEYLEQGYPPHVDIGLDIDGNGTPDDWLVIEYAYNTSEGDVRPEGQPNYGALTGAWYQTFSDDTLGPAAIDDNAYAWLTSQAAGPVGGEFGADGHYGTTLADWKAGKTVPTGEISASTVVTHFTIEVDNWRTPLVQADVYVDDIAFNVNGMACFGSIQYAIDAASPGDTINVAAGTYTENVDVDKSLTLNGANYGIGGTGTRGSESIIDGGTTTAVGISASNVVLDGFTITIGAKDAASKAGGVVIANNTSGLSNVTVKNNIIKDISDTGVDTILNCTYGILTWGTTTGPSDIIIQNNAIQNVEEYSIAINDLSSDVTIDGNSITDMLAADRTAEPGTNIGVAIGIGGSAGPNTITVTNNTLNTGLSGTGMTSESPGGVGIGTSYYPTDITVTGNVITGNTEGIAVQSEAMPMVYFNDIYSNSEYGLHNYTGDTLNAGMNYWGDISGPTFEGTGQYYSGAGDKVSGNVNFVPWLTRDFQTVLDDNISYFGQPMVSLNTGWNTFSTPVALDSDCDTWGEYIALGDGLDIHSISPAYAFNGAIKDWVPLTATYKLKPCDAIYVRMAEPDVAAILYSPEPSAPTTDVYQGWNLVGLASLDPMPANNALTSLYMVTSDLTGYSVVISPPLSQSPWAFVRDGSPQIMQPTRGYWVFMENGPDTLAGFTFTPFSLEVPSGEGGLWEVPFEWYSMTTSSADVYGEDDDASFTYTLPWTFPFAGKEIVDIGISSNGYIELLESTETYSYFSESYGTMGSFVNENPNGDFIFAWFDDLNSSYYGFYGVEDNGDAVVVHWETETHDDYNTDRLNYIQLWLFPDGSIQWNFKEFNYDLYGYGLGTGIYESDSGILLNVALAMGEPDGIFNTPEKSYKYFGQYWP